MNLDAFLQKAIKDGEAALQKKRKRKKAPKLIVPNAAPKQYRAEVVPGRATVMAGQWQLTGLTVVHKRTICRCCGVGDWELVPSIYLTYVDARNPLTRRLIRVRSAGEARNYMTMLPIKHEDTYQTEPMCVGCIKEETDRYGQRTTAERHSEPALPPKPKAIQQDRNVPPRVVQARPDEPGIQARCSESLFHVLSESGAFTI